MNENIPNMTRDLSTSVDEIDFLLGRVAAEDEMLSRIADDETEVPGGFIYSLAELGCIILIIGALVAAVTLL